MLVRRKSACKTSAGSSKVLRWLTPLLGPNLDPTALKETSPFTSFFRVRVVPASLKLLQVLFFGGAALAVPMPVAVPSRSRIDSINGVQEEIPSCLAVF